MNKYRLKKDLPDLKAGAIFEKGDSGNYYVAKKDIWVGDAPNYHTFTKGIVEQSPEWFEKVEEPIKIDLEDNNKSIQFKISELAIRHEMSFGELKELLYKNSLGLKWTDAEMEDFALYFLHRTYLGDKSTIEDWLKAWKIEKHKEPTNAKATR